MPTKLFKGLTIALLIGAVLQLLFGPGQLLGALLMLALTAATAVVAHRRRPKTEGAASLAVVGLALLQLGLVIVAGHIPPLLVSTAHLLTSTLLAGSAIFLTTAAFVFAPRPGLKNPIHKFYFRSIVLTGLGLLLLFAAGALVSQSGSGAACPDWPLCYDALLPGPDASPQIAIQLLHRYAVAAVSILVIALVVKMLSARRIARPLLVWTVYLGASFAMQVMVGAFQVLFLLPVGWRVLHLAFASAAWASLVALLAYHWLAGGVEAVRTAHNARDRGRAGVPAGD